MSNEILIKDDDSPMGVVIKRPETKYLEHKSKLLNPGSNRILITGSSGTGKSTLVLSLLPMFTNKTTEILLASVKPRDDVHDAIKMYCEKENIKYTKMNDENETGLELNNLMERKKDDEHSIVIFDDFAVASTDTSKREGSAHSIANISSKIFRSFQISIIFITQQYHGFSTAVRENVNLKFVFAMQNKQSIDAWINDTIGMYYSGDNEIQVKRDLKDIYTTVYSKPHNWILCMNNPPQIREKWNNIIYPPELIGKIDGGKTKEEPKKKPLNNSILEKQRLYKEALELGLPKYLYKDITNNELKEYINKAKNKEKIINIEIKDKNDSQIRNNLIYNIKRFKITEDPKYLRLIGENCDKLMELGNITKTELTYILKKNGILEHFDLD